MRTFFELLPHRIERALAWRVVRAGRTRINRWRTRPTSAPPSPANHRQRLFIDLSVISGHDPGTGIQRVVRALALALLEQAPEQWDIRFLSARRKRRYFEIIWPDRGGGCDGEEMRAIPGDVFLGLDYALDSVRRHRRQLRRFRREGGSVWFLVHDLLPFHRPEWFSPNTVIRYSAWLGILAGMTDGFLCNSPQTEIELKEALAKTYGLSGGYRTQVLPMGHAIHETEQGLGIGPKAPRFDTSTPFALMVGTLEPRKGHGDIIAAFDALWRGGGTGRLVLVGRLGWQVDALRNFIQGHPELGSRLLWFDDVDDAELSGIYEACTGVIVPSHGEGFGLPVIEALGHGKPVLARDLPVFRTHESKGVRFFPADASPADLAKSIEDWLSAARQGEITIARPTEDWRDAARLLLSAIEMDRRSGALYTSRAVQPPKR